MPNQPEYSQPGCSKDPPPAAREQPPRLPAGQIVPAVADVEMLEAGASANRSAAVARRGWLSKMAWIVGTRWSNTSDPAQFSNKAEEHARETHRQSKLITRIQCFLQPTSVSFGGNKYLKKVLRVCVRFKKECDGSSCHQCESCGVCPHQYTCSCFDEYKLEGGWCAHIHTMHMLTQGEYKSKMRLYIQTELNYTMMRHVRAFVQRDKFMKHMGGFDYLEILKDYELLSKDIVQVKNPKPNDCTCSTAEKCCIRECAACRCQFECTCEDYAKHKQVCQHIHSVAMIRKGGKGFKSFDEPETYLPVTLPDDWNYKYYVEMEHEMSFYIDTNRIQEKFVPLEDFMRDVREFGYGVAMNAAGFDISESSLACVSGKGGKTPKKIEFDRWWIVMRKSKFGNTELQCRIRSHFYSSEQCGCKEANRCARCKICFHDYTCSCVVHQGIICRHVHAIHRLSKESQETKAEAARYIEAHYNRPAIEKKAPPDFKDQPHRSDDSHMPPEAKRMDVLPPLTD